MAVILHLHTWELFLLSSMGLISDVLPVGFFYPQGNNPT